MPQDQFGAVSVASLGRGKTRKQLDARLDAVAQELRRFCFENGYDNTKKASAEVTLKVKIIHLEDGMFAVRAIVKDRLPEGMAESMHLVVQNGKILAPLAEELTEKDDARQKVMPFDQAPKDPSNPGRKEL